MRVTTDGFLAFPEEKGQGRMSSDDPWLFPKQRAKGGEAHGKRGCLGHVCFPCCSLVLRPSSKFFCWLFAFAAWLASHVGKSLHLWLQLCCNLVAPSLLLVNVSWCYLFATMQIQHAVMHICTHVLTHSSTGCIQILIL